MSKVRCYEVGDWRWLWKIDWDLVGVESTIKDL